MIICLKSMAAFAAAFLMSLLLVSCGTVGVIPAPKTPESAILVIEKGVELKIPGSYLYNSCVLELNGGSEKLTIPADYQHYSFMTNLKPGTYKVTRIRNLDTRENALRPGYDPPEHMEFTLRPGEITVFPYFVKLFAVEKLGGKGWMQVYYWTRLSDKDMTRVFTDLSSQDNYASWKNTPVAAIAKTMSTPVPSAAGTTATTPASSLSGIQGLKPVQLITVLDFSLTDVPKKEGDTIVDFLSDALFKTGGFRILERSQRTMALREISVSLTDSSDIETQLRAGKLLSTPLIVTGSVSKIQDQYFIAVRIIQVETGETLGSQNGKYNTFSDMIGDIESVAGELVRKI